MSSVQKIIYLGGLILMFWSSIVNAQNIPQAPTSYQPINDFANLLSKAEIDTLSSQLRKYEKAKTTQIVVVTINSLEGSSIEQYANKLFNSWGIGQKGVDNGVLLLVAKEDRKMRIETGYGAEAYLTDLEAGQIIDEILKPNFRKEKFGAGIELAIGEILKELGETEFKAILGSNRWGYLDWLGIFSFIFLVIQIFLGASLLQELDGLLRSTVFHISFYYFLFCLYLEEIKDPFIASLVFLAVSLAVVLIYLGGRKLSWMQKVIKYMLLFTYSLILSALLTAVVFLLILLIVGGLTSIDITKNNIVFRSIWGGLALLSAIYFLVSGRMEKMIMSGIFSGGGGSSSYSSSGSSSYSSSYSDSSSWGGGSSGGGGASGSW